MAVHIKFSKNKFKKELMKQVDSYKKEQTLRLISYAQEQMQIIGSEIAPYFGLSERNTGNLLDSLCWGVWVDGRNKPKAIGYYREQQAEFDSYLHELSPSNRVLVNGRLLAQQFLSNYEPKTQKGWEIAWGVLAPYYAYWETGHENILLGGNVAPFYVMTQRFDHIQNQLGTRCVTRIEINRPQ